MIEFMRTYVDLELSMSIRIDLRTFRSHVCDYCLFWMPLFPLYLDLEKLGPDCMLPNDLRHRNGAIQVSQQLVLEP